jgi:hypothetical protein
MSFSWWATVLENFWASLFMEFWSIDNFSLHIKTTLDVTSLLPLISVVLFYSSRSVHQRVMDGRLYHNIVPFVPYCSFSICLFVFASSVDKNGNCWPLNADHDDAAPDDCLTPELTQLAIIICLFFLSLKTNAARSKTGFFETSWTLLTQ